MRRGRPKKIRMRKNVKYRAYGAARRGAKNPKQIAATLGRRRKRRRK